MSYSGMIPAGDDDDDEYFIISWKGKQSLGRAKTLQFYSIFYSNGFCGET